MGVFSPSPFNSAYRAARLSWMGRFLFVDELSHSPLVRLFHSQSSWLRRRRCIQPHSPILSSAALLCPKCHCWLHSFTYKGVKKPSHGHGRQFAPTSPFIERRGASVSTQSKEGKLIEFLEKERRHFGVKTLSEVSDWMIGSEGHIRSSRGEEGKRKHLIDLSSQEEEEGRREDLERGLGDGMRIGYHSRDKL